MRRLLLASTMLAAISAAYAQSRSDDHSHWLHVRYEYHHHHRADAAAGNPTAPPSSAATPAAVVATPVVTAVAPDAAPGAPAMPVSPAPTTSATSATVTATATNCAAAASGGFHVTNGQIIGPNGQPFIAKGIDLWASDMETVQGTLTTQFPGVNMVRVYDARYSDPSTYASFISAMTGQGIVVVIVDAYNGAGNGGGGQGVAFTGQALLTQQAWYQSFASTYANNPYVWFGPNNEPPQAGLTAWQQESYNTIRSAGNSSIIMLDLPGGGYPGNTITAYGMDASVYAQMMNVILDPHYYGWVSGYSTDQGTVSSVLQNELSAAQLQTASGLAPKIIGEYGNSTNGASIDPNWQQVVTAVSTSGVGATAWADPGGGGAGDILVQAGSLTPFGQMVAKYISSNGAPAAASTSTVAAAAVGTCASALPLTQANAAAVDDALAGVQQPGATPVIVSLNPSVVPAQATTAPATVVAQTSTQAAAPTAATLPTAAPAPPSDAATAAATQTDQQQAANNLQQADAIAATVNVNAVQAQAQALTAQAQSALAAANAGNDNARLGAPQP